MSQTVELPLWLLILILAFAGVTALSHFLLPSVRWFFRKRMERAVERLNQRLERPIEPFKLLRRHDMIQRLIYDPQVIEAVAEHARQERIPEDVAFEQARRYAREIVPAFSATLYFGIAIRLARRLSQAFYRVRVEEFDEAALRRIAPDATVIYVMNHRSNMDYVLVTYLAANRAALSYAVGEWARVWPLSRLIKAMGAYFIRRRSRNALYRRVLARYVQIATAQGLTQAVFPEGGLSLDGRVGAPRLGILHYIITGHAQGRGRDVVFVPVGLNYDRVLEDRMLIRAARTGKRRFRLGLPAIAGIVLRHVQLRLSGRFRLFGYAAVSFGRPLSLAEFARDRSPEALTEALGNELMRRIRAIVPVVPVPLVAACLLQAEGPLSRDDLIRRASARLAALREAGAHVRPASMEPHEQIGRAIDLLCLRRLVRETPEGLRAAQGKGAVLSYYAAALPDLSGEAAAPPEPPGAGSEKS